MMLQGGLICPHQHAERGMGWSFPLTSPEKKKDDTPHKQNRRHEDDDQQPFLADGRMPTACIIASCTEHEILYLRPLVASQLPED